MALIVNQNRVERDLNVCAIGLDLLRLSLLHKSGNAHFTGDEDSGKVFLGELIAFAV